MTLLSAIIQFDVRSPGFETAATAFRALAPTYDRLRDARARGETGKG